ncbi:hypothetical protein FVEG_16568 [Fusarium verticillioides 7600]|uniref:Uncharacterized protein n=1 Tax=Gibberella moniliformis (strain M3125 / FGSC 7600) TaxID=334819 RepID=W7MGN3_GIBM7|nr:hypothetical protein FVEG_16568 [Fusarium verticillioides 7600]EWG50031.1 hypothetical protein FVEG_16568 [Fusarium verticillioides 7600]RBQ78028.1 hypothetical protein FVER14953_21598 [Fusarium verticillioides]
MSSVEQSVPSSPPIAYSTISMAGANEDPENANLATFDFDNGDIEITPDETEALREIRNIISHGYLATGLMPTLSGTSFSTEAPIEEQSAVSHGVSGGYISAH